MTEPEPEAEVLAVGKPPPDPGDPDSPEPGASGTGFGRLAPVQQLLVGLWVLAAASLAAAPFLTFFEYEYASDSEIVGSYDIDGWGRMGAEASELPGHGPRVGVVLVVLAAALVVATAAAMLRRASSWSAPLGVLASAATVGVSAMVLIDVEAQRSREEIDQGFTQSVSIGMGVWLVLAAGLLAAAAIVIGLVDDRRRRP